MADFLETRRVAVLLDEFVEVIENLALPFGEREHRPSSRWAKVYAKERRRSTTHRVNTGLADWSRMRNVRLGLNIPEPGSRPFDVAGFGLNSIDLLAVV